MQLLAAMATTKPAEKRILQAAIAISTQVLSGREHYEREEFYSFADELLRFQDIASSAL